MTKPIKASKHGGDWWSVVGGGQKGVAFRVRTTIYFIFADHQPPTTDHLKNNMYVLIVYDVEVKRVAKAHKFLKRHLHWVQNSVFEGEVTDAQLEKIKVGLKAMLDAASDSVLLYSAREQRWLSKEVIGPERGETSNLL
jgi:CRISPR-associated protein Cas2